MKKIITLMSLVLLIALNSFASGVGGSAEPLSLGLLSFYGYAKGDEVVLEWDAMNWATSRTFSVERSADGITWTRLREVPAAGAGSSNAHYTFSDEAPIAGNAYYRIGLSNDMGEQAVSSPLRIYSEGGSKAGVSLFPNPCTVALRIAGLASGSTIIVCNAAGAEVFRGNSDERLSINTAAWQPGMYFVSIATPDGQLLRNRIMRR